MKRLFMTHCSTLTTKIKILDTITEGFAINSLLYRTQSLIKPEEKAKMSFRAVLLFYFLLASVIQIQSQTLSTFGKEFIFALFPEKDNSSQPSFWLFNDVYVSSLSGAYCTLSHKGQTRYENRIEAHAGSVTRQQLSDVTQLTVGTKVENKGMYLNCTDNVWLYAYNRQSEYVGSSDAFSVIPIPLLSTDYLIPSQDNNPIIGVVAKSPNTAVDVHLRSTCKVEFQNHIYKDGEVMKFTLNTYDVLQIVHSPFTNHIDYDCDFHGTRIKSSSPIAVFSGSVVYNAEKKGRSHLMLQVPPSSAFSNTVIVPSVPSATEMNIRVLASEDETSVSIKAQPGGVVVPSILLKDRGDVFDYNYTANTHLIVTSTKPVMVVHNTFFIPKDGDLTMFVPGTPNYEKNYLISSFANDCHSCHERPTLTIVAETTEIHNVYGVYSAQWENLNGTKYSVGTLRASHVVQAANVYRFQVTSKSPILVRLHHYLERESYGFIAGYGIPSKTPKIDSVVKNSVHLQCLPDGFVVTVDFSNLSLSVTDLQNIHMGPTCAGTVQGDQLVFNVSYDQCHTEKTVEKYQILFKNSIWYAPLSSRNVPGYVQWIDDMICSHPLYGIDSVHIYPQNNATSHVTTSGQIQTAPVQISLYKDASFQTPFIETKDKAVVGQPIYVQVAAPSSHSLILIVNYCHAHLTSDPGNFVSHPLISQGCPVDGKTKILASRNLLTRFQFEMLTLPLEDDGIHVTCNFTFCATMDFTPKCKLGCHTDLRPSIIGK